ncbi:thiamine phosphate synthase [Heyndrickxia acidiproducens]|uniref:thiamine phosphate synthase n=1 Tax=Heyndrickxia acidiproducens TaxID=1121084 RepID=UPI00035E75EC|nr:thiamine phosphate synthase [Heyndrickxia acidiproducens]
MNMTTKEDLRKALKLYFIMGSNNCQARPQEVLEEAIKGGITIFQFREKGTGALKDRKKQELAEELQFICQKHDVPFIVDDDVDLALILGADGVHIGQDDEPVEAVRSKIGDKIIGVSAYTFEEAEQAVRGGADYIGAGPIFPTQSKEDAKKAQGTQMIKKMRNNGIQIPIVGIGGINLENAAGVIAAGADGISVISAIASAENVTLAAETLRNQIRYYSFGIARFFRFS